MELELDRIQLRGFQTVLETTLYHEETMEMIVPDACPDILRIVDTEASVCVRDKSADEGRVELSGTVQAIVLYLPDGESGVRCLPVKIPFRCMSDSAVIHADCSVVVSPQVQSADTRSLNPRKVLVRVNLAVGVKAYRPIADSLCCGVLEANSTGVEQMVEEQENYSVVCVQEKPFTFSDELTLSSGRPEVAQLLKTGIGLNCSESKVIGNKLIIKGTAAVRLFYRATTDQLCTAEHEMVFSQIMEVSDCGEDVTCMLEMLLGEVECTVLPSGDGRVVSVQMEVLAQAVLWEKRRFKILTDLYSTCHKVRPNSQNYNLQRLLEQGVKTQTVRETIDTATLAREVCNTYVCLSCCEQKREGNQVILSVQACVTVLYSTEDAGLQSVSRQIPVTCAMDLAEMCVCSCTCRCAGEVYAVPTAGGLEVRFGVDFHFMARAVRQMAGVCGVEMEEEDQSAGGEKPSVILRRTERGERLWDIAKSYRTTVNDIKSANDLGEEEQMNNRLLLIPKKR